MPLTVSNPRDLLLLQLADLLFVERQLSFQLLPELLAKVSDPDLAGVLADHVEPTKRHAERLEDVFRSLGAEPSSSHSPPFTGLVDQHSELAGNIVAPTLADLFHAAAAAHTEHHEIAAYRALVPLARALGDGAAVELLETNLADEQHALAELELAVGRLASQTANASADAREH